MNQDELIKELTPVLADHGLELDALEVVSAGKRRVLRVVVDGDGPAGTGPTLDDVASATRSVSSALDDSRAVGNAPYVLEVTSRGVNRPLTKPQHWRRNIGRLVAIKYVDGSKTEGRIDSVTENQVTLLGADSGIDFSDIDRALITVEMNPKPRQEK